MPDVMDAHVSLVWRANTGSTFDGEIALWGFRIRPEAAIDSYPTYGTLTPSSVEVLPEIEDTTDFTIAWAHADTRVTGVLHFTQANMKLVAEACRTFALAAAQHVHNSYSLTEIKIMARGADGKSPGGSNRFILKTPIAGGASGSFLPNNAICVSLRSNFPGRRGKGRMFVGPVAASVVQTSGLLSTTTRNTLLGQVNTLLNDVAGITGVFPSIVSYPSFDFFDPRELAIGDEMDVQNRRRAQRDEIYVTAVHPPA